MREEVLSVLGDDFETMREVPLYVKYQKPFSENRISKADIVAKKGNQILVVEVEATEDPSPKLVIADIMTTNLATECVFRKKPIRLSNVWLFIVAREFKDKSIKRRQLLRIKNHLKLGKGCLRDFDVCPIGGFKEKLADRGSK